MKIKLLTIFLLLVTSQVFAKELRLYDCATYGDDRDDYKSMVNATACNSNCKQTGNKIKIKVNENTNKVLVRYFDAKDGSFLSQFTLKTMKHDLTWLRGQKLNKLHTEELEIFDKENWTYVKSNEYIFLDNVEDNQMDYERRVSMRNGTYHNILLNGPRRPKHNVPASFECGK